jgi:hypothetical protein
MRSIRVGIVVALVSSVLTATASVAHARPIICTPGTYKYSATVSTKTVVMTHGLLYAYLAPGAYASKTLASNKTLTASFTQNSSGGVSVSAIFVAAGGSFGDSLQIAGSKTSSASVTQGVRNTTNANHQYVFFDGTTTGNGSWNAKLCGSDGTVWLDYNYGNWSSFHGQVVGVLRCDQDADIAAQWGYFSVPYKAVTTCT